MIVQCRNIHFPDLNRKEQSLSRKIVHLNVRVVHWRNEKGLYGILERIVYRKFLAILQPITFLIFFCFFTCPP